MAHFLALLPYYIYHIVMIVFYIFLSNIIYIIYNDQIFRRLCYISITRHSNYFIVAWRHVRYVEEEVEELSK